MNQAKPILMIITGMIAWMSLAAPGFKTYTDRHNGFSLSYPRSWSVKGQAVSGTLIKADFLSPDKKSGLQVRLYQTRASDFYRFAEEYTERFLREMPRVSMLDSKFMEIAGYSGCEISFDGRARNGYFLKSYLLHLENCVFVFQCGTPFEDRYVNEPILDEMAQSFSKND